MDLDAYDDDVIVKARPDTYKDLSYLRVQRESEETPWKSSKHWSTSVRSSLNSDASAKCQPIQPEATSPEFKLDYLDTTDTTDTTSHADSFSNVDSSGIASPRTIGYVTSSSTFRCTYEKCSTKSFGRQAELRRHYGTCHTTPKPVFWCPVRICTRSEHQNEQPFVRRDLMKDHVKRVHGFQVQHISGSSMAKRPESPKSVSGPSPIRLK
jgi:hypothetical protein